MKKKMESWGLKASFLPVCVMAAAMLTACSADEGGAEDQEVAVQVRGTIDISSVGEGTTRADDGLNASSLSQSGQKAVVKIDNGSGTYGTYEYTATGTTISSPSPALPNFPGGVDEVHVYGYYPKNASGDLTYTVAADQSSTAGYCASDVLGATNSDCTRTLSAGTWSVTPASLTFKHLMSKLKLTVTPGTGVTINSVTVKANKKVTFTETKDASYKVTGFSAGSASENGTITLLSGGSATASAAYCCVFPPQMVASTVTDFIVVTATVDGQQGTINYKLSANKTFASDTEYAATLTVNANAVQVSETVTIGDWTTKDQSVGTLTPDRGGI